MDISQVPHVITRSDDLIPLLNEHLIHLLGIFEGPPAIFDDVLVPKMGIRGVPDGHLTLPALLCKNLSMPSTAPIVTGAEYLALPREAEAWLIRPLIPVGGSVIIYGDAKVGKSYAALQLANALVQGGEWLGFPVTQRGRVVYVQLDTPRNLWAERLEQLKESGIPVDVIDFADRETLQTMPFNILEKEHYLLLQGAIRKISPVAVVVDTIREAHDGDENESGAMKNVVSALQAAVFPAALILISHGRKTLQDAPHDLISDVRGSNYVVGRMDAIIKFSKASMGYTGRAIEEGHVRLRRQENGLWVPATAELEAHIEAILLDTSLTTILGRAQALQKRLPDKSEESCRSALRRYLSNKKSKPPTT